MFKQRLLSNDCFILLLITAEGKRAKCDVNKMDEGKTLNHTAVTFQLLAITHIWKSVPGSSHGYISIVFVRSAVTSHLPNPNHYWMLVVTVVWLLSKAAQLHFFYILSSINGNMRSFSVWTSVALKPPSASRSYGSRFLVCSYDHGSSRLKLVRAFDRLKAGNLSWKTTCAFMAVGLRQMRELWDSSSVNCSCDADWMD